MQISHPTFGNGKICYLEIPTDNISASAEFYRNCFDWNVRTRGDGSIAFDDGVGEVSGTFITGHKPASEIGILIHIMVADIDEAMKKVEVSGGKIIEGVGRHLPEITARIADPYGNIWGLYQDRKAPGTDN